MDRFVRVPSGAARSRSDSIRYAGVATVLVLACTALQLLYQDGARSWNTIYAEDGLLFFVAGPTLRHRVDRPPVRRLWPPRSANSRAPYQVGPP